MSGATFSRIKNWTTEVLSNTDLNAEIDNILNHLDPTGVGDYSDTATMMQIQTSPGSQGSESLATSLAGEIERLRFVIQRIMGSSTTYWYDQPSATLSDVSSGLPANRIISGVSSTSSSTLLALLPNGTAASLVLTASTATPFAYMINGIQYSITSNVTISGLSCVANANVSALVTMSGTLNNSSKTFLGMYGTYIPVAQMDASITAQVGTTMCLKSTGGEYLLGYINSPNQITSAWRGCFYDSSANGVTAALLSNNQNLYPMKLTWVYANTSAGLVVAYTNPTINASAPGSPLVGDYWFDLTATAWKTWNSVAWQTANATLIGICAQDGTACKVARTFDKYKATSDLNTVYFNGPIDSNGAASFSIAQVSQMYAKASVFGTLINFQTSLPTVNAGTNWDGAGSANYAAFFYLKESGQLVCSQVPPLMRYDLDGLYHPFNTWRALAVAQTGTSGSASFTPPVKNFRGGAAPLMMLGQPSAYDGVSTASIGTTYQPIFDRNIFQSSAGGSTAFTATITAAQWGDLASVTIGIGLWKFRGALYITALGTMAESQVSVGIGTVSGTTAPLVGAANRIGTAAIGASATVFYYGQTTAPTIFYLKGLLVTGSPNAALYGYYLEAERVDALTGTPP